MLDGMAEYYFITFRFNCNKNALKLTDYHSDNGTIHVQKNQKASTKYKILLFQLTTPNAIFTLFARFA